MKDRILNILMLIAVAAALMFTWLRSPRDVETAGPSPLLSVLPTVSPTAAPHPAEAYRARRAESRKQEKQVLLSLIEGEFTLDGTRALAQEQLLRVTEQEETELAVEAALAAWGDAYALCSVRDGAATVFVSVPLTQQQAALALDIAREASGLDMENIRVTGY